MIRQSKSNITKVSHHHHHHRRESIKKKRQKLLFISIFAHQNQFLHYLQKRK